MAFLYIASESDQIHLRARHCDYMEELLEELAEQLKGVDERYLVLLREALGQCKFAVDPARTGEWVVADETEQRWLATALTALNDALTAGDWIWELAPDLDTWLRYFRRAPVVTVEPGTRSVDLSEHADWITGKCKACGVQTTGLFEPADDLGARDYERYAESAAKGEWWCDECYDNRCVDCGEEPRAPEDDECCAGCRASRDAADVLTT